MADWNPEAYGRHRDARWRPLDDLLGLLPPSVGGRMLDLGCGDGVFTRRAASRLDMDEVVAVDGSEAMLDRARELDDGQVPVTWRQAELAEVIGADETFDVVLANASLHFLPDHDTLLPQVFERVAPGGWVAVHIPFNHDSRTHLLAASAASADELEGALDDVEVAWPQLPAEDYARMVQDAGLAFPSVQVRTYRHPVDGADAIVDWLRHAGLRPWLEALDPSRHDAFLEAYRRLIDAAYPAVDGDTRLLDYTRLLLVGRKPA